MPAYGMLMVCGTNTSPKLGAAEATVLAKPSLDWNRLLVFFARMFACVLAGMMETDILVRSMFCSVDLVFVQVQSRGEFVTTVGEPDEPRPALIWCVLTTRQTADNVLLSPACQNTGHSPPLVKSAIRCDRHSISCSFDRGKATCVEIYSLQARGLRRTIK